MLIIGINKIQKYAMVSEIHVLVFSPVNYILPGKHREEKYFLHKFSNSHGCVLLMSTCPPKAAIAIKQSSIIINEIQNALYVYVCHI